MLIGYEEAEGIAQEGSSDLGGHVPQAHAQSQVAQDQLGYGHCGVQVPAADAWMGVRGGEMDKGNFRKLAIIKRDFGIL